MILNVNLKECAYPIKIQNLESIKYDGKVLIITNSKIAGLHLNKVLNKISAKEVFVHTLQDGEEFKNMDSVNEILETAFNHKLDRKSLFISFGGGVISDLVGFAAGIYLRGVKFISIPTTLLAQVDASVGGKCGINNKFGKNLVGLFNQPQAVHIDSSFLKTLPKRELSAGFAEIIKMAICFDKDVFNDLVNANIDLNNLDSSLMENLILKALQIKTKVVQEDEKESGIRAALNYGHTFGHVIENLTNYKVFLHGEAVAIGMKMANTLARNLGLLDNVLCETIDNLLKKYGLDSSFKVENPSDFYEQFFIDKKASNGKITLILPDGIGGVKMLDSIPKSEVIKALNEYR